MGDKITGYILHFGRWLFVIINHNLGGSLFYSDIRFGDIDETSPPEKAADKMYAIRCDNIFRSVSPDEQIGLLTPFLWFEPRPSYLPSPRVRPPESLCRPSRIQA